MDKDCSWVTFVDSDDWLDQDSIKTLVGYLNKWNETPDMIIFSGYKNYPNKELISGPAFENETWFRGKNDIGKLQKLSMEFVKKTFPQNSINLDSACWRLVSVEFLKKNNIKFMDIPYREDGLFFLYTTEYAKTIVYLYETFYHYRTTEDSMVNMFRNKADLEHKLYLDKILEFIKKYNKDEEFINSLYYVILLSMEICITQKFFNKKNNMSFIKKQKACKEYFSYVPYNKVLKKIDIWSLRRNHFFKAIMIKYHFYFGLVIFRELYNKIKGQNNYN